MPLRGAGGRPMENIIYTFDFFDPWDFVTSDDTSEKSGHAYPATYPCSSAFRGWVSTFCPGAGGAGPVRVNALAAGRRGGGPGGGGPGTGAWGRRGGRRAEFGCRGLSNFGGNGLCPFSRQGLCFVSSI